MMSVLDNKIPPPLVAAVCAVAMWYLAANTPPLDLPGTALSIAAVVLGSVGVLVALAGAVAFFHARTTVDPHKPEAATALVTNGIYRYTRNPMYLGLLLLLVAWAVYLSSPAALMGAIAFRLYIGYFQIRPEERALETLFGSAFPEYASRVRRWL